MEEIEWIRKTFTILTRLREVYRCTTLVDPPYPAKLVLVFWFYLQNSALIQPRIILPKLLKNQITSMVLNGRVGGMQTWIGHWCGSYSGYPDFLSRISSHLYLSSFLFEKTDEERGTLRARHNPSKHTSCCISVPERLRGKTHPCLQREGRSLDHPPHLNVSTIWIHNSMRRHGATSRRRMGEASLRSTIQLTISVKMHWKKDRQNNRVETSDTSTRSRCEVELSILEAARWTAFSRSSAKTSAQKPLPKF